VTASSDRSSGPTGPPADGPPPALGRPVGGWASSALTLIFRPPLDLAALRPPSAALRRSATTWPARKLLHEFRACDRVLDSHDRRGEVERCDIPW